MIAEYFLSLDPLALLRAMPGTAAQGIIWGIMALGVYITFRILDFPDLTVDGSLATGAATAVMLIQGGMNPALSLVFSLLAGMAAGMVTGLLHTGLGIPGILASILTQVSLYSVNLGIMGKSNQGISLTQQGLVASSRYVTGDGRALFFLKLILGCLILVAIVYWFFGTEMGASIRATGCNPQMARAQGINTNYTKVLALTISNGLVGLCGGILAQYQGAADGSRDHQRGDLRKALRGQKDRLCLHAGGRVRGGNPLLRGLRAGALAEDAFRLYETVLRARGCGVPGCALLKRPLGSEKEGLENGIHA